MGYKILKPDLTSITATGASTVQYIQNEWVCAPRWLSKRGYTLTFFQSTLSLVDFIRLNNFTKYVVWKCLTRNETFGLLPQRLPIESITRKRNIFFPHSDGIVLWPYGTRMAGEIMLTNDITAEIKLLVTQAHEDELRFSYFYP